jgi:cytochrome c551/c552
VDTGAFPQVGAGGRNAMAGPTYYSDLYPGNTNLPDYYNEKVIVYDWMRGWMKAVSLFSDGTFNKMEPFASGIELNNLIDMELGPDGRIYLLEYGSGWFTPNEDSGLSYIEYNGGNRPPVIDHLIVDKTSGPLPLSITANIEAMDREDDAITFVWDLGDGTTKETTEPQLSYTYDKAGEYRVNAKVKDDKGEVATSEVTTVVAGNSRPEVSIELSGGNSSFFIAGVGVNYNVNVSDPDGETIDPDNIYVSVDYMEGMDEVNNSLGHQQVSAEVTGKALAQAMDCKTCHKEQEASIGPNYLDIAMKYKDDPGAMSYIQEKIVEGGSGVWGEVTMPAHPNITRDESRQLAAYIRSLADDESKKKSLPPSGQIMPNPTPGANVMVLTASYTDSGVGEAKPLTGFKTVSLMGSTVPFSPTTKNDGMNPVAFNGMDLLLVPPRECWFVLPEIDLKGVKSVGITAGWQAPPTIGLDFEMRLNAPDGKLVGTGSMPKPVPGQPGGLINIKMKTPVNEKADEIYFVYKHKEGVDRGTDIIALSSVRFSN